jgi:type IX secretion system PorP/SprF family membrane protein
MSIFAGFRIRGSAARKRLFGLCVLSAAIQSASAQDIHFTQFYELNVLRNPAQTGIFSGDYKAGVLYRTQWSSISKPFTTAVLSAEYRLPVSRGDRGDFFSVGLLGFYDKAGSIDLKTTGVYPAVSYNKAMGDAHNTYIAAGFTFGYLQRSFDPSKMTFNSQYGGGGFDPTVASGENVPNNTLQNWDVGAGVSVNSNLGENNEFTYFAGVSAYHMTKPPRSFYANELIRLQMKAGLQAGLSWKPQEQLAIALHGNYTRQGTSNETIIGGLVGWKRPVIHEDEPPVSIYGGAFYRLGDALMPTLRLEWKRMTLTASYDMNISRLRAATNLQGGYEISLFGTGLLTSPKYTKSRTMCPKYW